MPSHSSHSKASSHQHHPQQRHPLALTLTVDGGSGGGGSGNHSSNNNSERIEWSRSTILGFIEDYRRQRVLWDPNTKGYHIKQVKYEALRQLGLKYGTEIRSIRSKIKSLRSSFHREHGKVINGQRRGVHYQPMWFAYEAIHFILDGEQHQHQLQQQDEHEQQQQQLYGNQRSIAVKRDRNTSTISERGGARRGGGGRVGKEDDNEDHEDDDGNEVGDVEVDVDISVDVDANKMCVDVHAERTPGNAVDVVKAMADRRRGASDYGDYSVHHKSHNLNQKALMTIAASASSGDDNNNNDGTAQQQQQQQQPHQQQGVQNRADSDTEMQHFDKIISAEDVKTELIESDAAADFQRSPLAYLSLTPTITSSSGKKRKRTPQPNEATTLLLRNPTGAGGGGGGGNHHHRLQDESQTTASLMAAATKYLSSNNKAAQEAASSTTSVAASATGAIEEISCHMINPNNSNNNKNNIKNTNSNNNVNTSGSSSFSTAGHVDEYGVFGEYVAITIRKLKTSKAKIVVKHLINNLLYEAELGQYDYGIPASKEPPQLYKT